MQVFATLKRLMGLLEPILAHPRPICPQKGTPNLIQKCSKKCPKTRPKQDPKNNKKMDQFCAPNWPPKSLKTAKPGYREFRTGGSKKLLVPRGPQGGSRWPRGAQDSPKLAPKSSQDSPKMAQDGPEEPKTAPSSPQKAPKIAPIWDKLGQDGAKWSQDSSKTCQRRLKRA